MNSILICNDCQIICVYFTFCLQVYTGFKSRVRIAALHFNENSGRAQMKTAGGELAYLIRFPKYKYGNAILTKVMTKQTFGK